MPSTTSNPPPGFCMEASLAVALGACVMPADTGPDDVAWLACLKAVPREHVVLTGSVGQKYTDTCRARTEHGPQDVALDALRLLLGKPEVGAEVIVGVNGEEVMKVGRPSVVRVPDVEDDNDRLSDEEGAEDRADEVEEEEEE